MSVTSPASRGFVITKNNDTTFPETRGLWIGGAGNIKVDFGDNGIAIVITNIAAGTLLPFRVTRVYATDTTATDIVGLR